MKKIINIILVFTILMLGMFVMPSGLLAQVTFTSAIVIDKNLAGAPHGDFVSTTNCDEKKDISVNNLGDMNVYVCDGNNPFLAWDNNNGTKGKIALHNVTCGTVTLPDVALVESKSTWYAIVVYNFVTNGGPCPASACYCDLYKYTGGSFSYLALSEKSLTTTIAGGAHIDADQLGNFLIVWYDNGTSNCQQWGGTSSSSTDPIFSCMTADSIPNTHGYPTQPDVTIFDSDYTIYHTDQKVYYTYKMGSTGDSLFIATCPFDSVINCQISINNGTTIDTNYKATNFLASSQFDSPRISCPNGNITSNSDWTVVVGLGNMSESRIEGYTKNGSSYYSNRLTKLSSTDTIDAYSNEFPTVSYDYAYNGVMVAWTSSYKATSPFYPQEPIAVQTDLTGAICCSYNYWIVPNSSNNNPSGSQRAVSVSGRDNGNVGGIFPADTMLYVWYNNNGAVPAHDVFYKLVPFNNSSLRLWNMLQSEQPIPGIYPNPNNGNFQIKLNTFTNEEIKIEVYNLMGDIVYQSNEVAKDDNYIQEISLKDLDDGIYFIKESGILSNNNWKIILTK